MADETHGPASGPGTPAPPDAGAEPGWFVGHSPRLWPARLGLGRVPAVRRAAAVVESLLPAWRAAHPNDPAPVRAVEAARRHTAPEDDGRRRHAEVLAKACGASRRRSLGDEHHIAEAARALARAVAAGTDAAAVEAAGEALAKAEEHLVYGFEVEGEYDKGPEVRERLFRRLTEVMAEAAEPVVAPDPRRG